MKILITGGSGFIGMHLANRLVGEGHYVRLVDYKPLPDYVDIVVDDMDFTCDLRILDNAMRAMEGIDVVYALAADMGGMGYISFHDWEILTNNMAINLNTARAAMYSGVERLFFSSSACVYPEGIQTTNKDILLMESDAWQGKPDTIYGVEKLAAEDIYYSLAGSTDIEVRIARFHNIYGPCCAWRGGREKAPAALCRKVAAAVLQDDKTIEIWGDGEQKRSFCFITDCLDMVEALMDEENDDHPLVAYPINIGSAEGVTINELVDMIELAAGVTLERVYIEGPQGVRSRNAVLESISQIFMPHQLPQTSLQQGIYVLYDWVSYECEQAYKKGESL